MSDAIETIVTNGLKAAPSTALATAPVKEGNPLSGVLDSIPSMKVFGLNVGDAVKGMAVAGIGDVAVRILVSKLPANIGGGVNTNSAIAKGVVAALLQSGQAKKFLGANAANWGSFLLTVDALNDLVQVRASVSRLVSKFTSGFLPGSGLVWGGHTDDPKPNNVVAQAGQVVQNYMDTSPRGA